MEKYNDDDADDTQTYTYTPFVKKIYYNNVNSLDTAIKFTQMELQSYSVSIVVWFCRAHFSLHYLHLFTIF